LGALYAATVAFALSSWFIDDSEAFRLSTVGWYRTGGQRLLLALVMAVLGGSVVYIANRFLLPHLWPDPQRSPTRLHWWVGGLILIAGVVGAITFVVTRPYM
jgi:zinc transporter ZupT